jgi:hypothetical protein
MAYTKGNSSNIIVGAAALFVKNATGTMTTTPAHVTGTKYVDTLSTTTGPTGFTNVGYTSNGLELQFQPDFGEVNVDQVLDVAKLFKQGMQVTMATSFAEATLENLLIAIARPITDLDTTDPDVAELNISAGDLGDVPVERGLIAVGSGYGGADAAVERIYSAYRAISIENVSVSSKRDEATMFEVSFRLLPNNDGSYGKIVDRTDLA